MESMKTRNYNQTKIICTLGPASDTKEMIMKLVKAGMHVGRLNFSHSNHDEHGKKINIIKEINKELKTNVSILLDTKGPEIRLGEFVDGEVKLSKNQIVTICVDDILGTSDKFTVTYKDLYRDVKPNSLILINDGQLELVVNDIKEKDIICTCKNTGVIRDKQGINVPGITLGFEYLSEKDVKDIIFGCEQEVDFIAASFVRRAQDVIDLKKVIIENGHREIQVIAKIENSEGVKNIDEILKVADGIMIARGDLGVEVPAEEVPLIQKELIRKCKDMGKIVITATQMLESMQENPRPTRAEVSDVANAIFDGTDAIMLSGESAQGKYPEEAVMTMSKIAIKTEAVLDYTSLQRSARNTAPNDSSEAICMSVAEIAYNFDVKAIIAFTTSGLTAKKMSRYRPKSLIIATTPFEKTTKLLSLNWGVKAVLCKQMETRASMIEYAQIIAKENGIEAGQKIIITAGASGTNGTTSFLELIEIM